MASPGLIIWQAIIPGRDEVHTFIAPNMTTAERDNISATNGMIIYNTTTNTLQGYVNGAWANL